MELKQLIANFAYRIEPKAEGGFIAHGSDPSLPVLEAATREELTEKIQARINDSMSAAFPGLKLSAATRDFKFALQIEPKAAGGYIAHSIGPDGKPIEGATHEEVQQRVAEKLVTTLGEYLLPNLPKAFGNLNSKDVKVLFDIKTVKPEFKASVIEGTGIFSKSSKASDNSPIQPETSGSWTFFRFLLIASIIACLMYFFFRH